MSSKEIAPGVWQLTLPSHTLPPFTHTNSYLVSDGGVGILIDPGFHEQASWNEVVGVLEQAGVTFLKAILLTHTHDDHCAGLAFVQEAYPDVKVYVHPLELNRLENVNAQALNADRNITVGNQTVRSVFTPGHSPGHLSYYLDLGEDKLVFAGDVVAGHGSTWIGMPEGDVADYLRTLDTLRSLKLTAIGPGHGEMVTDPYTHLNEARQHRLERLEQVYGALESTPLTLTELREAVYPGVHEKLAEFAEYSLLALLKKLMNDMRVLHLGGGRAGTVCGAPLVK